MHAAALTGLARGPLERRPLAQTKYDAFVSLAYYREYSFIGTQ